MTWNGRKGHLKIVEFDIVMTNVLFDLEII